MYLDPWMIVLVALTFGLCHWISRKQGIAEGAVATLKVLHDEKIIVVSANGSVSPYRPVEEPVKKRKRNARV